MKPIIRLDGYKINSITYNASNNKHYEDQNTDTDHNNLEQEVSIGISDDNKNGLVVITIQLEDYPNAREIRVELTGTFTVLEVLERERIQDLLAVNGVALLYPYVRSIISIISTLDSNSAIVIPTINTKIFDEKQD